MPAGVTRNLKTPPGLEEPLLWDLTHHTGKFLLVEPPWRTARIYFHRKLVLSFQKGSPRDQDRSCYAIYDQSGEVKQYLGVGLSQLVDNRFSVNCHFRDVLGASRTMYTCILFM